MKPAMASATLADIKTHTRRIAKIPTGWSIPPAKVEGGFLNRYGSHSEERIACPYGGPGDRLWVRESYFEFGHWEPVEGVKTKGGRQKWRFCRDKMGLFRYADNPPEEFRKGRHAKDPATPAWHKRLARFMPRALSRIMLEIVEVRIERLNDISEADVLAEGIERVQMPTGEVMYDDYLERGAMLARPVSSYATLWESINGPGSWAKNPLVWVIEFRRVQARTL